MSYLWAAIWIVGGTAVCLGIYRAMKDDRLEYDDLQAELSEAHKEAQADDELRRDQLEQTRNLAIHQWTWIGYPAACAERLRRMFERAS